MYDVDPRKDINPPTGTLAPRDDLKELAAYLSEPLIVKGVPVDRDDSRGSYLLLALQRYVEHRSEDELDLSRLHAVASAAVKSHKLEADEVVAFLKAKGVIGSFQKKGLTEIVLPGESKGCLKAHGTVLPERPARVRRLVLLPPTASLAGGR